MLKSATFQSLTTVPNGKWSFADGLNVIIGENGLGKSHVLKALYSMLKVQSGRSEELTKTSLEKAYAEKLSRVMRPESLGRLVKRKQGRDRCEIRLSMKQGGLNSAIGFATNAKSQVDVLQVPESALTQSPVYLPTRELVTLCPWFLNLYDNYHLEFEETWRDTVSLLGAPSVKGPRENRAAQLLKPLEEELGGKVEMDASSGRFYLRVTGEGRMEMPLVAEGLRKFAMLARLINTGVLLDKGYLFWDEPETNLNPKLIKTLARCIVELSAQGIQVFIATHSLFLLREFEILLGRRGEDEPVSARYFGLSVENEVITLRQSDDVNGVGPITSLEESLAQSDRYMEL
ncbi:ATP/GTP-binding protein [Acidovorax sp. ACV01]|uniref:AAA family ATPase n=1 Tax=Acidovorax sp. ACV01 TaxID=2769311 RepID=UPI001784E1E9|nr:ATP-binding protein [Acidovorax sp. ACV01]MBD9393665.1 ATP-binding protein [Acidovorax sp. ACV01]